MKNFKEAFVNLEKPWDRMEIMNVVTMSCLSCEPEMKEVVAIEECSELQKELTKMLRKEGNTYNLLEEMADVSLVLLMLQRIHGFTDEDMAKAMTIKARREEQRYSQFFREPYDAK